MFPRHFFWLLVAATLSYVTPLRAESPTIQLQIGKSLVQAEVAKTQEARMKGLMGRKHLGKNQGMLFVYDAPSIQAMWMRNTVLPLSVAFINERGVILNIANMKPLTDTAHPSAGPAKYALEMNQGWFDQRSVKPGDHVKGLPSQ